MTAQQQAVECFATVRLPEHGLTFYADDEAALEYVLDWLAERGVTGEVVLTEEACQRKQAELLNN